MCCPIIIHVNNGCFKDNVKYFVCCIMCNTTILECLNCKNSNNPKHLDGLPQVSIYQMDIILSYE